MVETVAIRLAVFLIKLGVIEEEERIKQEVFVQWNQIWEVILVEEEVIQLHFIECWI